MEMLRPSERRRYVAQLGKRRWYSIPMDVITAFVFRVSRIIFHYVDLSIIFRGLYPLEFRILKCSDHLIVHCLLQQKISNAADDAARKYKSKSLLLKKKVSKGLQML